MAKQFGAGDEAIAALGGGDLERFPPAERAALAFADAMTRGGGAVDDGLIEALRGHYSEPQMVEIASVVGMFNYFNRYNNAFRMDITLLDPDVLAARVEDALRGYGGAIERLGRAAEIVQQGRRFPWVTITRGSGAGGGDAATTLVTRGAAPADRRAIGGAGPAGPRAADAPSGVLVALIRRGEGVAGAISAGCDRADDALHEDRHVLERIAALLSPHLG